MNREVFLDTSFAIALSSSKDTLNQPAIRIAKQLQANRTRLVTTRAVLLEIGNALSKQRYRQGGVQLLRSLETDPQVEIVVLSESLYEQSFQLYCQRLDQEWGLVDCVSFVVMRDRNIWEALTADIHFTQAGFRALLRE
jgi:hypothetical protein